MERSLYQRLGVPLTASPEQIRTAYRRLARQFHPDRQKVHDDGAKLRFQEIQEAYEVLMDTRRRQDYDLRLLHLLSVEDYLSRYQELILTASGLDMAPPQTKYMSSIPNSRSLQLLTAA